MRGPGLEIWEELNAVGAEWNLGSHTYLAIAGCVSRFAF